MESRRHRIIFDFDGTIADSLEIFIDTVRIVTKHRKQISEKQIEELRKSTPLEIINILDIKKWQLPNLLIKGRRIMSQKIVDAKPFDGIKEVIEELSKYHDLYILSSNSNENIELFLQKFGLNNLFTRVYSDVGLWSKSSALKKLIRREGYDLSNYVYIGDEIRDVEASKKIKIKFIAVGWGFINPNTLKKYEPNYLVHKPQELIATIREIDKSF